MIASLLLVGAAGAIVSSDDAAIAAPGTFVAPPVYSASGLALAVYTGGSLDELESASRGVHAIGVWVQDSRGNLEVLPVGAPAFLKRRLERAFPPVSSGGANFSQLTPVTLVAPD